MSNSKAVSSLVAAIFLIAIVVIVSIVAAYTLGAGTPQSNPAVTVYIDKVKQTGNYSQAQTLEWGTVSQGNTYTKNFTVYNNAEQPLTLKLYTAEPAGATQSWAKNLSTVQPLDKAESTLVLTLSETAQSGKYTWRLLAVNGSAPTPTPTSTAAPTPTPTPTPNTLQYTISGDMGVKNVTVTYNSETPFIILGEQLPKTYLFTSGDKLKFLVAIEEDYIWNGWDFNDGTRPDLDNPLIIVRTGNFTVTANTLLP